LFIAIIEATSAAAFLPREEKPSYVRLATRKNDTLKFLLVLLWETKSIDTNKYALLSEPLAEVGRMLSGWMGQLQKQNSPTPGEK